LASFITIDVIKSGLKHLKTIFKACGTRCMFSWNKTMTDISVWHLLSCFLYWTQPMNTTPCLLTRGARQCD